MKEGGVRASDGSKWVPRQSGRRVAADHARYGPHQAYIMVQNELTRVLNEVRDEVFDAQVQQQFADLPRSSAMSWPKPCR